MLRLTGALLTGSLLLSSSFASAQDTFALDTPEKRFSYAIGQNVGNGIKGDLGDSGFDVEAFTAAQVQGVPSRFLYFPTEGHWVLSPQNGVLWHRVFFEWLGEHCGS